MRIIKVLKKANGLELMGYKSTTALNDIYLSLTLGSDHFNSLDSAFRLLLRDFFKKNTYSLNIGF